MGENKKVLCKFKDELGGRIMTEFVGVRPKTSSFLIDDFEEEKKNKGAKKCVVKRILKFNDYKDCLLNKKIILKSQQTFKSEAHSVYTEAIKEIALRSNDACGLLTELHHILMDTRKVCNANCQVNIK